jgi:hypothetical protein
MQTYTMSISEYRSSHGSLLLCYTASGPDREGLEDLYDILVELRFSQPTFGDERIWPRKIDLATICTPMADIDDGLTTLASGNSQ